MSKTQMVRHAPNVDELIKRVGIAKAAQILFVSSGTLTPSGREKHGVRSVVELAAKGIIAEQDKGKDDKNAFYHVTIPSTEIEYFTRFVSGVPGSKMVRWTL